MYCLHCKYTTKLRNDKEINALFASAPTEQNSPTDCTEVSDARYSPTDCTDFHRLGGYGIPCHTHAATKLSSHRIHGTHRNDWRRRKICTSVKSVGGSSTPEASVYSVKSVGDYSPPETSVNSVNSVGGLAQTNLEWVLWKEFGGWRGYGRMPYPPNL